MMLLMLAWSLAGQEHTSIESSFGNTGALVMFVGEATLDLSSSMPGRRAWSVPNLLHSGPGEEPYSC